jgi:thiol-disulfide isomerase/thioredoxin
MKIYILLLTFLAIATLTACPGGNGGGEEGETAKIDPGLFKTGRWEAAVTLPGGDIRFGLELERAAGGYGATLVNGEERVPVGSVTTDQHKLTLFFPAFNSTIDAALTDGVLTGTLQLVKRGGVVQSMPFRAEYAEGYTFSIESATPEVDFTGRWAVEFITEDGETSQAIGEFHQDGTKLNGTFLTPTGDYRYLSGSVAGHSIELSCFDGAHAFLFKAASDETDALEGEFWSGTKWHERWRARRDDNIDLPDPYELTWIKEGYDGIAFEFPGLDGRRVSLDDARFENKVVIVTLAGSWCPNCRDEATFLSQYYKDNKNRGLEIVTLMYEHLRDETAAMKQIERFKTKHDIQYTLLYAGPSGKEDAQKTLPMLNRVVSFPTMIFVSRGGEVRHIHTGFTGPGTGEHYEDFKAKFNSFVDQLLAE